MALEAGFYRVSIVPERPLELSGFIGRREKVSLGVHDEIGCEVLVLKQGVSAAIVSCDLLGIPHELVMNVRDYVTKLGIGDVLIAATHTHYAPAVIPLRGSGNVDRDYVKYVEERIKEGIEKAVHEVRRVRAMYVGSKNIHGMCRNRVYGRVMIDDSLILVRIVDDENNKVILLNFPCHPVSLGHDYRYVSADYVQYIYRWYGNKGVNAVFLNGAAGDIDPAFSGNTDIGVFFDDGDVDYWEVEPKLYIRRSVINIPLKYVRFIILKYIYYALLRRALPTPYINAMYEWATELRGRSREGKLPQVINAEIMGIRFSNELALVSCPCELFNELGALIRRKSPFEYTVIAGYANGLFGYVASKGVHHYESDVAYRFYGLLPLSDDAPNIIIDSLIDLLKGLK